MIKIQNLTGYKILLPDGRYIEKEEFAKFKKLEDLPEMTDITLVGCRENIFVHLSDYYRNSFGEICNSFRTSSYLF